MTTGLYSHPDCMDHRGPPGHPECPERLLALMEAFSDPAFAGLNRCAAPLGVEADILRAHAQAHFDRVCGAEPQSGINKLDPDTFMSPGSLNAALRGVGAVVAATKAVVEGVAENAFCVIRPPGHHAERDTAMGFCLFNNVAIAARHARQVFGLDRVAIVDFDVHHGNGTEEIFRDDATVLYASTHQMPFYPGTGAKSERGAGNIFNAPLQAGDGSAEFRDAISSVVLPALDAFEPQLLLISAGFDAHEHDPLAQMRLQDDDFSWVTAELMAVAGVHAGGRVVSVLEGGYDCPSLSRSAALHLKTLARL